MSSFLYRKIYKFININKNLKLLSEVKKFSNLSHKKIVLGIETSCDDTGCAIVDTDGKILGESLFSQQKLHLNYGGIIPPIAQTLHRENIERVVEEAVTAAKIQIDDVDAIAGTVKPGLPLSLIIGMKYAKHLCRRYNKPCIPIHHMEAHALTIRLVDKSVEFPFLVLLISGGHCLLAVVESVDKFLLLGQSLDDAPGEALDKAARRLKLHNLPEYCSVSGGQAIEIAASKSTDPLQFNFPIPLTKYRDCNFSFSGLKNTIYRHIKHLEQKYELAPDEIVPGVNNLCAGYLLAITRHICHRVQRGMEFVKMKNLIPDDKKILVASGGAACNNFIADALTLVCHHMGYRMARPPPKLCTDNGIMIAWNGVERLKENRGVVTNLNEVDIQGKCPLGVSLIDAVTEAQIKCDWVRLSKLYKKNKVL